MRAPGAGSHRTNDRHEGFFQRQYKMLMISLGILQSRMMSPWRPVFEHQFTSPFASTVNFELKF
jgi:hypothetical protein